MNRDDDVAIAVDPTLTRRRAAVAAQDLARQLAEARVPLGQRVWIIAAADDLRIARIASAITESIGGSRLLVHNPHELDDLVFQRRYPGQRRGGLYLNAHWQQASIRIVVGEIDVVAHGLSAWFNPAEAARSEDLNADLVVGA